MQEDCHARTLTKENLEAFPHKNEKEDILSTLGGGVGSPEMLHVSRHVQLSLLIYAQVLGVAFVPTVG